MKQVVIPKFSSETKEAAWWDAHRSEIEAEIRQRMSHKRPLVLADLLRGTKASQPVTLRIPKEDLETARRLAAQKGLGYQTYIKMLLREALAKNGIGGLSATVRSAEMRSHLHSPRSGQGEGMLSKVCFRSYNPYESVYPGLRVVSREALHLIKTLRSEGYSVVVEPDDGRELHYFTEKGFREVLSDPVYAFVVGIPVSLILNLIAGWISQLRYSPKPDETNLVLEFDEEGKTVRYSQSGRPISDAKFSALLLSLEGRKRRFEDSRRLISPYAGYPIPINLEHTEKVVGWCKGFVFDDRQRSIGVDETRICDDETWDRIQSGELKGFSVGQIVLHATCLICGQDYVDCNHVAGNDYAGRECVVRTTPLPAEISLVKDPVQPLARIDLKPFFRGNEK